MSALKKYIQPESKELFYLVGMFRTQSPGDNISVALRKLLQGGRREVRLYTCLQQREQTVWKANIRYQVKEFSILCMGRCKPLGSLNSSLLYAPQLSLANPVSLFTLRSGDGYFLHSPSSSAITMEGRGQQYPLCNSFGSHHSYLEARNCWWLWHFFREGNGPPSSTLAWKIPWTEEPGGLQSMGSLRVRHDWATSLSLFTFMRWRRKWQPTPEFLPGESRGRRSLVGCCLWGHT